MGRIGNRFRELGESNDKALVTFITAGDPDLEVTEALIPLLAEAGADIIELGVPFSDPMADGPTIQLSSERALKRGANLPAILSTVKNARRLTQVPILLMGYYNPVLSLGLERFATDASEAGVDGLLIVDLPPEESEELRKVLSRKGIDLICLLTPTSDDRRLEKVFRQAGGFLYYVSVTGVTGARADLSVEIPEAVRRIKERTSLPVAVGFGISTPDQAAAVAAHADGVVVGSALVKLFESFSGDERKTRVREFVSSLKRAIAPPR
ncbi:MAG TPA: tryptophan synthase subunit alpha [Verrucomicrobiae bacterium]|nr:tryptophan synthase subunit alpha [Verrucomicrobiae bacterium]